jgi:hypothetical protein
MRRLPGREQPTFKRLEDPQLMMYRRRGFGRSRNQQQLDVRDGFRGYVGKRCLKPANLRGDGSYAKYFVARPRRRYRPRLGPEQPRDGDSDSRAMNDSRPASQLTSSLPASQPVQLHANIKFRASKPAYLDNILIAPHAHTKKSIQ